MTPPPVPAAPRCFAIDELPRERWKNGGGWTRTVASATDADGQLRWRVSVADIEAAGPFSAFAGLDRSAVMLRGGRLRLQGDGQAWTFDGPGSLAQFPGELALQCDAPDRPTRLWNVMVRRGVAQARLQLLREVATDLPAAPDLLVFVLQGRFDAVGVDGLSLGPGEGLHRQGAAPALRLTPVEPGSLLLVTELR